LKHLIPKYILLTFLLFFQFKGNSQDIKYARNILETLCSPSFHGRGYAFSGDKVAAEFIEKEFKSIGLKSFGEDYFQYFNINVNTFPGDMMVKIGGQELAAGADFQIDPNSRGREGKFKVCRIKKEDLKKGKLDKLLSKSDFSKKNVIVLDPEGIEDDKDKREFKGLGLYLSDYANVIYLSDEKFTWSVGREQKVYSFIEIKREKFPVKTKSVELKIENQFRKNYETQNIVGYFKGTIDTDSFLVFSAHYDHLGRMGKDVYIPGANDNGSGMSMMLDLAKHYAANPPKYNMVFIAFGAEEVGLVGSKHFTENPTFDIKKIKFLINVDLVGTGEKGITVVNGSIFKNHFDDLVALNKKGDYLSRVKIRGGAANSDHYWFTLQNIPSFFIYTMGGIAAYHDINDRPETLPFTEYEDLIKLIVEFYNTI